MAISSRRWRWIVTASAIVVALIVASLWFIYLPGRSDPNCKAVRAMIDYNRSQSALLESRFDPEEGTEASVADYQIWANHMQQLAADVTDPDLAPHAHQLAALATETVKVVQEARRDTSGVLDTGPPPWAKTYGSMAKQFHNELQNLNSACPA